MAKKKKSNLKKVLGFVAVAAAGGVIGGYSMRYWMRKVEPRLSGKPQPNDELEPYENPAPPMGVPPIQPFQMPQITPVMPISFPTFTPMPFPAPYPAPPPAPPAPAPQTSAPAPTRGSKVRDRRMAREAESAALLASIAQQMDEFYESA